MNHTGILNYKILNWNFVYIFYFTLLCILALHPALDSVVRIWKFQTKTLKVADFESLESRSSDNILVIPVKFAV